MAGIRFQTTVYSYNSWSYFIQIWDRNYTGSTITEITLGQGGPQINWDSDNDDRFSTIMSSSCEIPIMVEGTLLENWLNSVRDSYEEKDVYVHIYRNTQATASSLIWSGFLLMDLNSTVDEFFPYEFKLTFTDGLSLLKEVDFAEAGATKPYDSSEMFWGPASYSFWMKTVLGKVGAALTTEGAITDWEWRTSINWYNTGHGASAPSTLTFDPFAKTEVQVSMFHNEETEGVYEPRNCYDVLNELLKHWGARIVYWRHKFWIIQIPEYNTAETGTLANPDNINTRKYFHSSNSVSDAFDNLNDYWTPYQVFLQGSGVIGPSKIVGTKYDFKAPIKEVIAKYITGSGENYFGGFPTTESTIITGVRINNLADANNIYLDIPLKFTQNRANVNSGLTGGQFSSFSAQIYYQLAATNLAHGGSTTKFLHYNSSNNSYSWNTNPPSTTRPYWYASNLSFQSGSSGVMTQQLGGPDNGAAILIPTDSSFTGLFDISIQIFNFVNGQASNKYAFIDDDTGANWADPTDIGLSWQNVPSVSGTTISSTSYVSGGISIVTYYQGNGNPFAGQLLPLGTNNQIAATAQNIVQNSNNDNNSTIRNFDELLWGDSPASVSIGSLEVIDTSGTRTTTVTSGQWGVGVTNGTQTFSKLLLDRFLEGQLTSIRVANFRLVIPTEAKEKDDGTAVRPQYINPVGLLVENRPQEAPMSYVMQRGTFHVLMDEWDFQGFEIQSESTSGSTVTVTDTNFGTIDIPVSTAPPSFLQRPPSSSITSAARNNIITTLTTAISGLGSDLVTNGNFETDSDWTKGSGWSISTSAKQAQFSGSADAALEQAGVFTEGTKYKVSIDVAEISGGELEVKDQTTIHQAISSAGGYEFTFTAANTALQLNANTGSVERTIKINSITAQEVSSTTSLAINSIGEAIFATGDKFSLLNINNNTTYDLTINANQSANDTTLTITSFDFEAIVPVGSIVTFNKKNLIKQYQDDTLQEVTDRGNTTTNSIMIGSSSAPSNPLHIESTTNSLARFKSTDNRATIIIQDDDTEAYVNSEGGVLSIGFNASKSADNINVTPSGRLGIGVTNASEKLEVSGDALVSGDVMADTYKPASSSEPIKFKNSSSTELARITDGGNVGIGTTSPSEKLEVVGNIRINSSNSNGNYLQFRNNGVANSIFSNSYNLIGASGSTSDFNAYVYGNNPFNIWTFNQIRFTINGSGNVGIGTTSPSEKLEVSGNIVCTQNITLGNNNDIKFKNSVGNAVGVMRFNSSNELVIFNGNSPNGDIFFKDGGATGTTNLMIDGATGNVGIGLTNPSEKLEVSGDIKVQTNTNAGVIHFGDTSDETKIVAYDSSESSPRFDFFTNSTKRFTITTSSIIFSPTGSESMRLTSTGLGIGLTNPETPLAIKSNSFSSQKSALSIQGNTNTNDIFRFGEKSTDGARLHMFDGGVEKIALYTDGTNNHISAGNLGISTSTPETKLDVNGTCTTELLQLKRQESTPSEPNEDRSIIYMDAEGDIKVMINVGGIVVTRTLATYA